MRRFDYIEPLVMLATVAQWLVLATLTGAIVGGGTTLFLKTLFFMTDQAAAAPLWVRMALLPAGGFLNGLLLYYGYRANRSGLKDTVFAAVHAQEGRMPLRTMLIKPVAAVITLACGGSAGKEGPCSHIGASLGAAIGHVLHLNGELRKRIVACGVSAGFASVFGTPIAGAIYGVEVLAVGRIRHDFLFPAIIAGITSFQVSTYWGVPYTYYSMSGIPAYSEILFFKTVLIGILCGFIALAFVEAVHRGTGACGYVRDRFGLWPP
ncbi:MAG TPA: chloride channel protein, partial [Sphingomonadaceae bacterium]|nr:chloride channel protein [Sphingomonadaceae bacterium]